MEGDGEGGGKEEVEGGGGVEGSQWGSVGGNGRQGKGKATKEPAPIRFQRTSTMFVHSSQLPVAWFHRDPLT